MAGRPKKTYTQEELDEKIRTLNEELKVATTKNQKNNIYAKISHWENYNNRKEKDAERYKKIKKESAVDLIKKYSEKIQELSQLLSEKSGTPT